MKVFPYIKIVGLVLGITFVCVTSVLSDSSDPPSNQISSAPAAFGSEGAIVTEAESRMQSDVSEHADQTMVKAAITNEGLRQDTGNAGNQSAGNDPSQNSSSGIFQYLLIFVVFLVLGALMYGTRNDSKVN